VDAKSLSTARQRRSGESGGTSKTGAWRKIIHRIPLLLVLLALQGLAAACGLAAPAQSKLPTPAPLATASPLAPSHAAVLSEGLTQPMAVAVSSRGDVYVADGDCRCIRVFDRMGASLYTLGPGLEPGKEMVYPVALALDNEDLLYVSDLSAGDILRFKNRNYIGALEVGAFQTELTAPAGIFLKDGAIYVNELSRHQVLVFRLEDGQLVHTFGNGKGTGEGFLAYPNFSLALQDGSLLVADSNNNRLQHFGLEGSAPEEWVGPVSLPRGLALDAHENIFAASALAGRIEVYSPQGRHLGGFARFKGASEDVGLPIGIAVSGNYLYIADRLNGRVLIGALG